MWNAHKSFGWKTWSKVTTWNTYILRWMILKWFLKKLVKGCGLDSSHSRLESVANSCEFSHELLGSKTYCKVTGWLNKHLLVPQEWLSHGISQSSYMSINNFHNSSETVWYNSIIKKSSILQTGIFLTLLLKFCWDSTYWQRSATEYSSTSHP
jgi:hypothetical protein